MKKYFKEHAGTILVLIVFFSLIGLAQVYGKSGGVIDTQFQSIFQSVSEKGNQAITNV
jgi:hypothetical protein